MTTVIPIASLEEGIDVANDSEHGLSSAIFAQDVKKAFTATGGAEHQGAALSAGAQPRKPVAGLAAMMSQGVNAKLLADEGVDQTVAKTLEGPLAETEAAALADHHADLRVLEELLDRVRDLNFQGRGDLPVFRAEVFDLLDELRASPGVIAPATTGGSLGHAP